MECKPAVYSIASGKLASHMTSNSSMIHVENFCCCRNKGSGMRCYHNHAYTQGAVSLSAAVNCTHVCRIPTVERVRLLQAFYVDLHMLLTTEVLTAKVVFPAVYLTATQVTFLPPEQPCFLKLRYVPSMDIDFTPLRRNVCS